MALFGPPALKPYGSQHGFVTTQRAGLPYSIISLDGSPLPITDPTMIDFAGSAGLVNYPSNVPASIWKPLAWGTLRDSNFSGRYYKVVGGVVQPAGQLAEMTELTLPGTGGDLYLTAPTLGVGAYWRATLRFRKPTVNEQMFAAVASQIMPDGNAVNSSVWMGLGFDATSITWDVEKYTTAWSFGASDTVAATSLHNRTGNWWMRVTRAGSGGTVDVHFADPALGGAAAFSRSVTNFFETPMRSDIGLYFQGTAGTNYVENVLYEVPV